MTLDFQKRRRLGALAVGLFLLGGCWHMEPSSVTSNSAMPPEESAPKLTPAQVADVKIAYGRTLEKRGTPDQARTAYLEALKLAPGRADACGRLAVLCDQLGQFDEASSWHGMAVAAQPKNPDFHCNRGYSLYLQGNMIGAEKSLRECLAVAPEHARGHNNLGMILSRTNRSEEALSEFSRAGCTQADAYTNLAFGLSLEHHWVEARACYEYALAADPTSTAARLGLQELDMLVAKRRS